MQFTRLHNNVEYEIVEERCIEAKCKRSLNENDDGVVDAETDVDFDANE